MKSSEAQTGCQIQCLDRIPDPTAEVILPSLGRRLRLKLTRRLDPRVKRAMLRYLDRFFHWFSTLTRRSKESSTPASKTPTTRLKAGDVVRVRSREEIQATLNHWREFKGCTIMQEMWPTCDTTQRVLKPVERFFDERDGRLKKCRGVIFLEGLVCQGTEKFGPCDRSCFYFWREEWLEKIEGPGT